MQICSLFETFFLLHHVPSRIPLEVSLVLGCWESNPVVLSFWLLEWLFLWLTVGTNLHSGSWMHLQQALKLTSLKKQLKTWTNMAIVDRSTTIYELDLGWDRQLGRFLHHRLSAAVLSFSWQQTILEIKKETKILGKNRLFRAKYIKLLKDGHLVAYR